MRGDFDEDEFEGYELRPGVDYGDTLIDASAPKWQPIDSAPKDGTVIILGHPDSEDRAAVVTTGMWDDADEDGPDNMGHDAGWVDVTFDVYRWGRSFGNPTHRFEERQPTHWMPLPEPPDAS